MYNKEERLELTKQVRVTEEAFKILKAKKKEVKKSMAKLVSELIIKYLNDW